MVESVSGFAALALFGLSIASLVLLLFMVLVQPIWCVVDCAIDGRRGTASKIVWIIALIVLYGIANWFYGAFAAAGPVLRRLTQLAWAFAIALLAAFALLFFNHAEFRRGIEREWQKAPSFTVHVVMEPRHG